MQDDTTDKGDAALLRQAKADFERCEDAESTNRMNALEDIRFAKLGEQWPEDIKKRRAAEFRPCLTINRMQAFIRQVVNDARQNKPQIKVRAADSKADPKTAEVINGLIKNIEYVSNADIAYDTAVESAVAGGFGYIRVGLDYAFDDSFDMDITIDRMINPMAVYGDPDSTAGDSRDWNLAFIVERMPKDAYKAKYGDKAQVDFDSGAWDGIDNTWMNDDGVLVAEYWTRKEVDVKIYQTNDGRTFRDDQLEDPDIAMALQVGALQIVKRRTGKTHKVKQVIMSGADILEENDWPGRYIPIIPVYGDEFSIEGKRYFQSLIHHAKDAQMMLNFWRTAATELVALAPRVPFIGPQGAFDSDQDRWQTANTESHAYLEYDGQIPPTRQPLDMGVAAGALQEALNASDDMKSIIGMYDASLGARSNETSGKAINARQREGDTATFHFMDNLSRAIRHVGRVIIDLIPAVYDSARIVRVIGEDGKERSVEINQPTAQTNQKGEPETDEEGNAIMALHDLTVGKYDLTVEAGPSFTTRRQEAAAEMTAMIQAFPQAAPILAGPLAKNMDWPGAQEIADKLEKLDPTNQQKLPPQVTEMIEQGKARMAELEKENTELKTKAQIEMQKVGVSQFDADTKRMKVQGELGMDLMNKVMPKEVPEYEGTE